MNMFALCGSSDLVLKTKSPKALAQMFPFPCAVPSVYCRPGLVLRLCHTATPVCRRRCESGCQGGVSQRRGLRLGPHSLRAHLGNGQHQEVDLCLPRGDKRLHWNSPHKPEFHTFVQGLSWPVWCLGRRRPVRVDVYKTMPLLVA